MAISITEDSEDSQEEYEVLNSATFSSMKQSGTIDDEIRSYDLDLWNSPICLRRNLVAPTFQIENQAPQHESQLEPKDEKESAETVLEENSGASLVIEDNENTSGDQDSHEGERFLSPIMEELSDVPSDFYNSMERPGSGEASQAQTGCPEIAPPPPATLSLPDSDNKPDDVIFMEAEKPSKDDNMIPSLSNPDKDQLSLHSLSLNDERPSDHPTLVNKHQLAHSSVQLKRKMTTETASDSEKTPEPKRKALSTEVTHVGQEENSKSPHTQPRKRLSRKESEYLREGEQHCVWKPGIASRSTLYHLPTEKHESPSKEAKATKRHLLERKRSLDMQIVTAQEALRSKYSGSLSENSSPRITFRAAVDRVSANLKAQKQKSNDQQMQFQDADREEQIKRQKALYSSRRRGSKASIKRLSPYSSPKRRQRNPSSTSHGSTSDESTKFKSLNNSPEHWWKLCRHSTSSPSMPLIFSGTNRPHHVSPLTTPKISSSDQMKRKSSACAPYEAFLRRQASGVKYPPFISPQRHQRRRHSSQLLPSPARSITNPSPDFTADLPASAISPHRVSNTKKDEDKDIKEMTGARMIPVGPQKSFSPSKSANLMNQLQHPLEKFNAAASPQHPTSDAGDAGIHSGRSAPATSTHTRTALTSGAGHTYPPGVISPLPQGKKMCSTMRKRSLSDGDV